MSDGYWNRQQPSLLPAGGMHKRPRTEFDMQNAGAPAGYDMNNYYGNARDGGTPYQPVKDTKTIVSAYERYLQNMQGPATASREPNAFGGGGGMASHPMADSAVMDRSRAPAPDMTTNGYGGQPSGGANTLPRPGRDTVPLPPDASNTLYVEGLPPDCTRREVAHIFRPFVGYKDLRLVSKESKHRGEPIILCFVDFMDPACAATAMSALQGYKMDEHDAESNYLRLQFSRYPGPRSGMPGRGKR